MIENIKLESGVQNPAKKLAVKFAYKLKEAAQLLSLSEVTLRRLITRGEIKRVQGVRHIIIPASEIERFLCVRLVPGRV